MTGVLGGDHVRTERHAEEAREDGGRDGRGISRPRRARGC